MSDPSSYPNSVRLMAAKTADAISDAGELIISAHDQIIDPDSGEPEEEVPIELARAVEQLLGAARDALKEAQAWADEVGEPDDDPAPNGEDADDDADA